jgi:hypothetical protein
MMCNFEISGVVATAGAGVPFEVKGLCICDDAATRTAPSNESGVFYELHDEAPRPHLRAKSRWLQVVHSIGHIADMDMKEALRRKCDDRITITHQQ